jgi:DUF971 family protein
MNLTPSKIRLNAGNDTLSIQWSDGHLSIYPYKYLRNHCPCATCEEAGLAGEDARTPDANAGMLPLLGQRPLQPDRAELVGRYALQIFWSDHHSTGIYAFNYLRQICPCAECTRDGGGNEIG